MRSDEAVTGNVRRFPEGGSGGEAGVPLLVLVGVSGSGKSTVGALLAQRWGCSFYEDTDVIAHYSYAAEGRELALSDLVVEQHPRTEEWMHAAALDVLGRAGAVVVLSASQARDAEVCERLDECRTWGSRVVQLDAQLADIAQREGMNVPRAVALGAPRALLARLSQEIRSAYAPHVDVTIATSGLSAAEVADQCEAACKMIPGLVLSEE